MHRPFALRPCATIAALLMAIAPIAAQQTFRSEVDLVHFSLVVTDKQGTPITGLKAEDFEVKEAGKAQAIKFFAAGDPETAPPLHIGFLLDTSGSMEEDIKDVRTAAVKFLNAMESAVDITLVDFDTEVRVARYAAADYPRLIERIRGRKPDGYTALYDALGVYLNGADAQGGQKVLIMYTDGGDTRSALNQKDVIDLLRASDVTVYVIGYLDHQSQSAAMSQRQQLDRFAAMTGGQALFVTSVKEVDKLYERVEREIAARYSLGYQSSDERANGAWRSVEIRLTRPDLKGARLRTREGYFAPMRKGS
jgi:Ca-activated chloride channel family protein